MAVCRCVLSNGAAQDEERRRRDLDERTPTRAKARFEYVAADGSELSLRENDLVKVLKTDKSGWWLGGAFVV